MEKRQSVYLLGSASLQHSDFLPYQQLIQAFSEQGKFLSLEHQPEYLSCYSHDSQCLHTRQPLMVFRPYTTQTISSFVKACHAANIPIAVRCGGTGLVGGSVAPQKGMILLTGHLRKILTYCPRTGSALVEPGVTPKQLSQMAHLDGWECPLEMMINGSAGLAGCLSTGARGYHQSASLLSRFFQSATVVDGQGEEHILPAALACGAEGMFGTITQLQVQLSRVPSHQKWIKISIQWETFIQSWEDLQAISVLKAVMWDGSQFYVNLQGEEWRIQAACQKLENLFPMLGQQSHLPDWGMPVHYPCLTLSLALPVWRMHAFVSALQEVGKECHLHHAIYANLLEGTLQVQVSLADPSFHFSHQMESFLVLISNLLEVHEGVLVSHHGTGVVLSAYVPPFYREEELAFLRQLHRAFDPRDLFMRQSFFPVSGKSLERTHDP